MHERRRARGLDERGRLGGPHQLGARHGRDDLPGQSRRRDLGNPRRDACGRSRLKRHPKRDQACGLRGVDARQDRRRGRRALPPQHGRRLQRNDRTVGEESERRQGVCRDVWHGRRGAARLRRRRDAGAVVVPGLSREGYRLQRRRVRRRTRRDRGLGRRGPGQHGLLPRRRRLSAHEDHRRRRHGDRGGMPTPSTTSTSPTKSRSSTSRSSGRSRVHP